MKIELCSSNEQMRAWRQFTESHSQATSYHRCEWKQVFESTFHWATFYLMASEEGKLTGILPLVLQKSWLTGKWLCSMPLLQAGGILASDQSVAAILLERATSLSEELGAKYLELRHHWDPQLNFPVRTDKVRAVLKIDEDTERMFRGFDSKLRTSIRKATKSGLSAEFGGGELLNEFYAIFANNMRDLGTPVYPKRFFAKIVETFSPRVYICVVRAGSQAVASAFLLGYRDTIESAWAASIRKYLPLKPNQFLHWKTLCFGARQGYTVFDLGRSSVGSGSHTYKLQWGAETFPLYWHHWSPNRTEMDPLDRHNPRLQFAIRAWQKLPLRIANWLGPTIVRHLPS